MSLGDFSQHAEDHARLFVYVKALGETSGALYGAIVDSLLDFPPVHPWGSRDSLVFVRLENRLPRWAKDGQRGWQKFQPYKRVLGLLAITQCHDKEDVAIVESGFKKLCIAHSDTVRAQRCLVFGSRADLEGVDLPRDFHHVEFDNSRSFTKPEVDLDPALLSRTVSELAEAVLKSVQRDIGDMRGRLEGGGRLEVLQSPFEGKEGEGDDDSKLSRTQKMGRINKHIADLYLLSGQLQSACHHFGLALTQLSRDPMWEGSANEGLGATLIVKKKQDDLLGQKTAELSIPSNVFGFLRVPQRMLKQRELSRRRGPDPGGGGGGGGGVGTAQGHQGAVVNGRASVYRRPKSPPGDTNDDSLDSIEDEAIDGELDGGEEAGIKTDAEDEETKKLLQKDLVVDRFTRAELHFRKAGNEGGVSRIELLFKFARYLVSQERHKAATEILQKIYWTHSYIEEHEKTTLYQAMAMVFQSMNYHRKAGLLLYYASLQAAKLSAKMQDYYEAHTLLSQALPAYKLSMAAGSAVAQATNSEPSGWPLLQAELMMQLVCLTQYTDQSSLLIQFSCMLLQNLHTYLSEQELFKVTQYLDSVTRAQHQTHTLTSSPSHSPNTTTNPPLHRRLSRNLSNDNLIAPLPLSEFPLIYNFRPKHFPPHLRPHKTAGSTNKGPFIVSQLHGKKDQRPEILWVVHDSGEISMDILNPLEFELRVENMRLLWEGVSIIACPSSLSLPQREKQDFTLTALPQEVGKLEITGYEHTVFGIHSKCSVKVPGNPLIRVVPPLPQLRVYVAPLSQFHDMEWNRDSSGSGSMDSSPFRRGESQRSSVGPKIELDLIDGESCKVQFRLQCQKETSVESLSLTVKMTTGTLGHKPEEFCIISSPSHDTINSLLPFAHREHRTFLADIAAKFPTYYRVKNDFVSSLSRQQPSSDHCNSHSVLAEDGGLSFATKKPGKSSQFRTQTKRGPPSSNTVAKQPLLEGTAIRALDSSPPSLNNLMDSLNIDVPSPLRRSSAISSSDSLTSAIVHSISPLPQKRGRGRGVARTGSTRSTTTMQQRSQDEWDFNQFGDLKRASIRSDPGDRKRDMFGRSPLSPGSATPLMKSPSLASRSGSLHGDGGETPPPQQTAQVFSYDHASLPRSHRGSGTGSPKSPSHHRPPMRRGGTAIKKNVISLPSDLRHNTLAILPTEVVVTGCFTLKYSGGEGGKAGYHRQLESCIQVRVHPSVYFDEFNIASETGKMNMFCLSFYVHNKSGQTMIVTCSHDNGEDGVTERQSVRLMSRQKHKVFIFLRCFHLPHEVQNSANESNMALLYSDQLAKMVTVRWEMEGGRRCGMGNLVGIRLPSSLLQIIQPKPLFIDVVANGQPIPMDSDFSMDLSVGVPVNVQLTLTNNSNYMISPSWLLVDASEFRGSMMNDLTGRMIHSGNLLQRTPLLEPGHTYQHQLSFIFFYKGKYEIKFNAYILSTSPTKPPTTKQPLTSPTTHPPTEETDGGSRNPDQSYVEQRAMSPILRGSKSPTSPCGESLLEYCGRFGGPVFAPLKIGTPTPFRCKLVSSTAEGDDAGSLTDALNHQAKERLISIAEVGEIMRDRVGNLSLDVKRNQSNLPTSTEQFNPPSTQARVVQRERGIRRHLTSFSSMHKRLSHLSRHRAKGPVLSLRVVDPSSPNLRCRS